MLLSNTKIIILCGGRGSRLGMLTDNIPKPLVLVGNRSIIERKLDYYINQGMKNFTFCTGYKGDLIEKKINTMELNGEFSNIGENAGILERLYAVKNSFSNPTIISYGDTYAEIDMADLLKQHYKSNTLLTLVTAPIENPFGIIEIDKNNKVTSFKEKPVLNHYIGYAIMQPEIFETIPNDIITSPDGIGIIKTINFLSNLGQVNAYHFGGLQVTVNTNKDLEDANKKIGKYYTLKDLHEE